MHDPAFRMLCYYSILKNIVWQVGIKLDGLVIEQVVAGSIAHECTSLEKGDRVVAMNEHAVSSEADLFIALDRHCAGPSISVTVAKPCGAPNRFYKVNFSTLSSLLLRSIQLSEETVKKNRFEFNKQVDPAKMTAVLFEVTASAKSRVCRWCTHMIPGRTTRNSWTA
jgi:hypothetical protein